MCLSGSGQEGCDWERSDQTVCTRKSCAVRTKYRRMAGTMSLLRAVI